MVVTEIIESAAVQSVLATRQSVVSAKQNDEIEDNRPRER